MDAPGISPLDAVHRRLGARMVPFGGWEMPLAYAGGTIAEHMACRRAAAAFDVSHLGTVRVSGPGAFDALQASLCNDLCKIAPGRAQYTQLLDDDGSVIDDIIVWWIEDDIFDVMPNASNTGAVVGAIGGTDTTSTRAVVAVQGPHARSVVEKVSGDAARVARFAVTRFEFDGAECTAAGTGYTGEDGVECAVPRDVAEEFWNALVDSGATPAGLGARDTLRLEAALPLHGHELGPGITPLQAGLGWVVGWDKPVFRGKAALEAERDAGPRRFLRGIATQGRQPPRAGQDVLSPVRGHSVGEVTSGNFSPVLGHGIALAFLDARSAVGDAVEVDARGRRLAGEIVATPFVRAGEAVEAG